VDLSTITPFVLTLDEEPNIGRVLDGLRWARRVLVVDSGSTDRTVEIARSYPNVEVRTRSFDSFAGQSNYALSLVETPWAMALDADYVVPPALVAEIGELPAQPIESGFHTPFEYLVLGRKLRGSLYPPRQVLFRKELARFEQDGHAHRVRVAGPIGSFRTPILHDDRKGLKRWLRNQAAYAEQEAVKLAGTPMRELDWPDRLRATLVLGPPAVLLYCLFGRGLVLDGRAGLYYTAQRAVAEGILSLKLMEARRKRA
jgi:glycosyltransferase involved in cell wall biosynthesis